MNNKSTLHNGYVHAGLCVLALSCITMMLGVSLAAESSLPLLRVSDNGRFLVFTDGQPFFWLGDTAWELFHRLDREEAVRYLDDRAQKGFTVIQAVALAELDGLNTPNAYGHVPLLDHDPIRPDIKEGVQNDYWDHVDFIVREANKRGLYIGFLPTWGDKWNKKWGVGPEIFTPANAEFFGEWLGTRYHEAGVIWILGGDRPVETDGHRDIIRAMARGIRKGDGGGHLITFHPTGGTGSSAWFHDEAWLDVNMRQNGHVAEYTGRYDQTLADYLRRPIKPVLDGEPIYEDHPVSFKADQYGHSTAADVRRPLYWNLFNGACGHTYGHHSVWQMWSPDKKPINNPLMPWYEALDQPGAGQMQWARRLLESRPFLSRIPDDSIIVVDRVATYIPGAGRYRFAATRDESGACAMIYAPVGRKFSVRMNLIRGEKINAWWCNPRNGEVEKVGVFSGKGIKEFIPPEPGELLDWILVLDDAAQGYPAPGTEKYRR